MPTRPWTSERGVLWAVDLGAELPRVTPRLAADFKAVGVESIPALAFAMGLDEGAVRRRLATGRQCFAACLRDAVIAYGWVSQCWEYIGEQERELRLQPDEAYIWDCATLPPYRGQRLYSALLSYILAVLREAGLHRAWIGTAMTNRASLRGFALAGFLPVMTLTYTRVWGLRLLWISGQPQAPVGWIQDAWHALRAAGERRWGPLALRWSTPAPSAARLELKV